MPVAVKRTDETRSDRTHEYYEANADRYAAATLDADITSLIEQLLVRLPPGTRVLDLGCGAGRDMKRLAAAGYRAFGLDYALTLIQIAAKASPRTLVDADMRCLPFKRACFDAVWAVASLLHIPKNDVEYVLAGITAVVRPGGLLFTSMKQGIGEHVDDEGRFFSFYTDAEWAQHLHRAGWKPLHTTEGTERRSQSNVDWLLTVSIKK